MLRRAAVLAVVLAACALATEAQTPPSLIVQRAGPNAEIDSLDQAKEIRIVFSEPMVALGRIPQPVEVPFVRIEPAMRARFAGPMASARLLAASVLVASRIGGWFAHDVAGRVPNVGR